MVSFLVAPDEAIKADEANKVGSIQSLFTIVIEII